MSWELSDSWTHSWPVYVTVQAVLSVQVFCEHPQSLEKLKGRLFFLSFASIFACYFLFHVTQSFCFHLFSSFSSFVPTLKIGKENVVIRFCPAVDSALFGKLIEEMQNFLYSNLVICFQFLFYQSSYIARFSWFSFYPLNSIRYRLQVMNGISVHECNISTAS